jgi:hypothetical protein
MFEDQESIDSLKEIREQFFNASDHDRGRLKENFYKKQLDMSRHYNSVKNAGPDITEKLLSWDPFSHETTNWFDPEWMFGIKEGFDIVIGNPPYINIANLDKKNRDVYKKEFSITRNKVDLYAYFIEKASKIVADRGVITYIIPHTWKATTSFYKLRRLIFDNLRVNKIIELESGTFDATVKPLIITLENKDTKYKSIPIFDSDFELVNNINLSEITSSDDYVLNSHLSPAERELINKISKCGNPLGEICKFTRGVKTSNDKRFVLKKSLNDNCKRVIRGRDVSPFFYDWKGEYLWYRPDLMKEKVGSVPHNRELFEVREKLILQRISRGIVACLDTDQIYTLDTCLVSDNSTLDTNYQFKYLLAILNSSLINYWYSSKFLLPTVSGYQLHQIPVVLPSNNVSEKIISLVEDILTNFKPQNKDTQITEYTNEVDRILYGIYGISEKEVSIIKKSLKAHNT